MWNLLLILALSLPALRGIAGDVRGIEKQAPRLPTFRGEDPRPVGAWRFGWKQDHMFRLRDEKPLYSVKLRRDAFGFRQIPAYGLGANKFQQHLFFLGCSYTFGEGVEDEETFSAQLAAELPDHRVVSMARSGASPFDWLYLWRSFNWTEVFPETRGRMVVVLIKDHISRLSLSWKYLSWGNPDAPIYVRRRDDWVFDGINSDRWSYRWIHWLKRRGLEYYWLRGAAHFEDEDAPAGTHELISLLKHLRAEYLRQYPQGEFVVTWMPLESPFHTLTAQAEFKKLLGSEGLLFWDADTVPDGDWEVRRIRGDGHPTAIAHKDMSDYVAAKIKGR